MKSPTLVVFRPPHFPKKRTAGGDGREQIHDRRRHGATHAEVHDRDVLGGGGLHGPVPPHHLGPELLGEQLDVVAEVGQEDKVPEGIQGTPRIAGQPILDDLVLRPHAPDPPAPSTLKGDPRPVPSLIVTPRGPAGATRVTCLRPAAIQSEQLVPGSVSIPLVPTPHAEIAKITAEDSALFFQRPDTGLETRRKSRCFMLLTGLHLRKTYRPKSFPGNNLQHLQKNLGILAICRAVIFF